MPFKSKRQLQTCYGKKLAAESQYKKFNWDCDEFLETTHNPLCLETKKSQKSSSEIDPSLWCKKMSSKEKKIDGVYRGPRGGYYIFVSKIKIYVPSIAVSYAIKKYGKKF